jgi:hypothetical protein
MQPKDHMSTALLYSEIPSLWTKPRISGAMKSYVPVYVRYAVSSFLTLFEIPKSPTLTHHLSDCGGFVTTKIFCVMPIERGCQLFMFSDFHSVDEMTKYEI